ncbi:MAG: hypothetical protein SGPRY_005579 [Prymnesium sp.]
MDQYNRDSRSHMRDCFHNVTTQIDNLAAHTPLRKGGSSAVANVNTPFPQAMRRPSASGQAGSRMRLMDKPPTQYADIYLLKCVKIRASTQKGQANFGPAKAAQRMVQLAPRKMNAVQELAPIVALCLEGDDLRSAELIAEVAEYCAATDADSMMYAVDAVDDWLSAFNCEPSA